MSLYLGVSCFVILVTHDCVVRGIVGKSFLDYLFFVSLVSAECQCGVRVRKAGFSVSLVEPPRPLHRAFFPFGWETLFTAEGHFFYLRSLALLLVQRTKYGLARRPQFFFL